MQTKPEIAKMENTQKTIKNLTLYQQATIHNVINYLLMPETSHFGQNRNLYMSLQCCFCHELFLSVELLERHEINIHKELITNRSVGSFQVLTLQLEEINLDQSDKDAGDGGIGNTNTSVNTIPGIDTNIDKHLFTLLRLVKAKSPAKVESVQNLIEMFSNNLIDANMFVSNLENIIYHTD